VSLSRQARIAVCIGAFEYGGQGTVVEQELLHLQKRFDLTLIAENIRRPVPDGVTAVEIAAWRTFPTINPSLSQLLRGFEVVHCHDSLGMMLASRAAGARLIVTSHGIAPLRLRPTARSAIEGIVTLATYPRLYRSANVVVAISHYVAGWLREFAKVDATVIPNGVAEVATGRPMRPLNRALLYVGEISRRKGIRDLIAGLRSAPSDVTLDLVGRGSAEPFLAEIDRWQLTDRIHFRGILDSAALSLAYAATYCTCSASLWEGFGLPILEGFGFGRPSIVRAQGGMLELVEQAGAGCSFRRPTEIAGCIEVVTENWDELSQRAIAFAQRHTWAEAFAAYQDLFLSLL